MVQFLQFSLLIFQLILAFLVGYLLLLTITAFVARRRTEGVERTPTHRFLFLVPAHNEEKLLPLTVQNLQAVDYPDNLFDIHVVADNCTDDTAVLARKEGAVVHERFNDEKRGKGYALQWLLQLLWETEEPHDAIIIVDADTIVSSNFLQVMDARLANGERVIQSYYAVRDPGDSWSVGLRYAALAVLHYLRPQGRMVLGGSAGLKGNGMVFTADLIKQHEWSASITEDIEFHMNLILDGERVMFAPDAVVEAEMPNSLEDSETQNERWEQGRVEMMKTYVPKLLKGSAKAVTHGKFGRAYLLFDATMEHLIPPFSILAALSGLSLVAACALLFTGEWILNYLPFLAPVVADTTLAAQLRIINLALGIFIILGQMIYLLSGLKLAKAPKNIYKQLLYIPFFMLWKIWLYIRVLFGRDQEEWVRTARNEDQVTQEL